MIRKTVEERFWEKVDVRGPDDCWEWLAGKDPDGYGIFDVNGKSVRSHRFVHSLHGEQLGDCLVCHSCDNPSCINPNHHVLADNSWNQRDAFAKGRHSFPVTDKKGTSNGRARLTEEDVILVRSSNVSSEALASKYGVNISTIQRARGRQSWSHIL